MHRSCECGETDLVSKVLNNECAVGHARLLKEGACLEVGVIQFLSPGIVGTFRHLAGHGRKQQLKTKNLWDHQFQNAPRGENVSIFEGF